MDSAFISTTLAAGRIADCGDRAAAPPAPLPAGLGKCFAQVREFHLTFSHPAAGAPTLQPKDRVDARAAWICEEVEELLNAETVVDQADAYIDILYFAIGGLVEIGVEPERLWNIVHAANMAKVWPDGSVHRRDDGKVIKPPGWVAPEPQLAAEVERQSNSETR